MMNLEIVVSLTAGKGYYFKLIDGYTKLLKQIYKIFSSNQRSLFYFILPYIYIVLRLYISEIVPQRPICWNYRI